jgi:hypothetical protein
MKWLTFSLTLLILVLPAAARADEMTPDDHAMRVLDEFMAAFNARDMDAWMGTLHFPHVRIASGVTRVDATPADMQADFDFARFAKRFEWDHSAWLSRKIVQSGPDKVHVAVRFARYRKDGSVIAEFDSLYIVALRKGRWGVVARSSFAP